MSDRPNYSWEYKVPDTKFWNSLDYKVGRNFLSCFSENEIKQLEDQLDPDLDTTQKLRLLFKLLEEQLAIKEAASAPADLRDVDYPTWQNLKIGIATMEMELGQTDEREKTLLDMVDKGPNGGRNLSAVYQLAGIYVDKGQFAEAEPMAREVIPWLQEHPSAGKDSPQVLGATRTLIKALSGQGKTSEAEKLTQETFTLIQGMSGGNFSMYQEEEKATLEKLVLDLQQMRDR